MTRAFKVGRPAYPGTYCVYRDGATLIDGEFAGAEPGDKITVELVEMSDEELDSLKDFEGW